MSVLPRKFYERNPAVVARELLGKTLVSRVGNTVTAGIIVETEAYFGKGDPASRASRRKTPLNEIMWNRGGLAFIYMVHGNWLFNITADRVGVPGAVLIRALEPTQGVGTMMRRRGKTSLLQLTSGPGKLTEALGITKRLHGSDVTDPKNEVTVEKGPVRKYEIASSHRIGVRKDVKRKLRFFVRGNSFVSK
mgnify:CR=1 FL=1